MFVKDLAAPVLAAIGLVGVIVLLALGKNVSVLLPIETALVGLTLGLNKDAIAGKIAGMLR